MNSSINYHFILNVELLPLDINQNIVVIDVVNGRSIPPSRSVSKSSGVYNVSVDMEQSMIYS